MTSSQESHEALSDPLPRLYSCFCDKMFTTYPGIYLHLKSKHGNLFQKYKKLKITKLFKKVKDSKGSEIYKLDKLLEKQGSNNIFYQKKIKQIKKRANDLSIRNDEDLESGQEIQEIQIKKNINNSRHLPSKTQQYENNGNLNKYQLDIPREFMDRSNCNYPYYMPSPFFNFPYGQPPYYPPFPHFPPAFQSMPNEVTIKKILSRYLFSAEECEGQDRIHLRDTIYDLIVYIDKNIQMINDPRSTERLILSYCDNFEPKLIGPLLKQYINRKKQEVNEENLNGYQNEIKTKQINYLVKLGKWLKEMEMVDFNLDERPVQVEQRNVSVQGQQVQLQNVQEALLPKIILQDDLLLNRKQSPNKLAERQ